MNAASKTASLKISQQKYQILPLPLPTETTPRAKTCKKKSLHLFSGVNPDLHRSDAAPLIVVEQPHVDARAPRGPHKHPALVTSCDGGVTTTTSNVGGTASGARER